MVELIEDDYRLLGVALADELQQLDRIIDGFDSGYDPTGQAPGHVVTEPANACFKLVFDFLSKHGVTRGQGASDGVPDRGEECGTAASDQDRAVVSGLLKERGGLSK